MGEKVEIGVGVTLGIPTYGRLVSMGWANAYKQLNPPINYNMRFGQVWNMKIAEARNATAKMALENGSKFLLFIGDDVIVPPYTMQKLIFRMENIDDLGVVGGIYCSKSDVPAPLVFRGNGVGSYWKWKVGEFFAVTGLGMDCTLIRTDVFRELSEPWFKTVNESDYEEGVNNAESWTEDLWFCKRVLEETDYTVFADASVMCEHWDFEKNRKFVMPPESYPMQRVENPKKMVDLGCGNLTWDFEGEGRPLRVDIRESVEPDFRADIRDTPFADDQFLVVANFHVLEHMDRSEVGPALDEWVRILAPGGEMRIAVPSLEWAAKNILDGKLNNDTMNVLYGSQTYAENFHKFGFTPASLRKMLEDRGLEIVEEQLDHFNIIVRALKPEKEESEKEIKEDTEDKEVLELKEDNEVIDADALLPEISDEGKVVTADAIQLKAPPQSLGSGGPESRNLIGKEL